MANGKPGDHPLTDLFVHGLPVFTPAIRELLLEIRRLAGGSGMDRLGIDWFHPPADAEFERELVDIRDRLKQEAKERGWEVD